MALPTIVGVGAVSADTGAITPALPSGVQQNDILLFFAETSSGEAITIDGWSDAPGSPQNNATTSTRLTVLWKRAGASESAPTTSDSGDHQIGAIMAIRGCATVGNPFLIATGATPAGGSPTVVSTAFRTFISDALVINAFSKGTDGRTGPSFSSWTNASLTNLTEQIDASTNLGNGGCLGVATGEKAAGGSVSATTASFVDSGGYCSWTAAMLPSMYDEKLIIRSRGIPTIGTVAITPALPVGWQEGDLLLTFVETWNQAVTISGWTEAGSSPAINAGTSPTRLTVFYKWATSTESAPTTSDSGDHQIGQTVAIRGGIGSGNPFDVTASDSGGNSASVSIVGATTTKANTLVLAACCTTRDPASSVEDATFSSWTNADLTDGVEVLDYLSNIGAGGGFGLWAGYKTSAGTYGTTTVTQANSAEYATWTAAIAPNSNTTLSAEAGTLTVSSQNAQFNWLFADAGTLSIAGESANINQSILLSADAGTLAVTSGDANLNFGYALKADPSGLTATPYEARLLYDIKLQAEPGAMTLLGGETDILAPSAETFTLSFIVDLLPAEAGGTYQSYAERLTVDGTEVKVRSWSYEEGASSIAGSLRIQLADVSQRSLVTQSADIAFELGEWTGSAWRWTSLLDTGRLRNSQYSISRQGIGPEDTFTFTAMSEMEDLLGTAPDNNAVWYDPNRHEVSADDFEGLYDLAGVYHPPTVVPIAGMSLYDIMQRVFVTECGFAAYQTNIPDFAVPLIEFGAGQPYVSALAGIIGMFEPTYTWTASGASITISVNDGTAASAPGMPSARTVTTARATTLGVADELDKVRALTMLVNQQRYSFDSWADRTEITNTDIGSLDLYPAEYVSTQTTTTYRDYFHTSNPNRPVKTEVRSIATESFLGGTELVKETSENFFYDSWGRLYFRRKTVDAKVPDPENTFALSVVPVFEETERLSWRVHPYRPGQYYRSKREVTSAGLVYVDSDNQQLGNDYVRDAVSVYRAGNVTDAMSSDWRKLKTFVERQKPTRNGRVEIRATEYDYLAKQFTIDEVKEEDGQIGTNVFVNEQQRVIVYAPGDTSVTGQTITVNMGELPLSTATALAGRLLARKLYATERVELSIAGIDPTIQRGMTVNPRGRGDADLGTYTVEARTMSGSRENGYTMSLQARSAATS